MSIPHAMTKENLHNHGQDPPKEILWETTFLKKKNESIELLNKLLKFFQAVSYYKNNNSKSLKSLS